MSDKEISYDVRLEEEFEKLKLKIWLLEELQLIPKEYHSLIIKNTTI
ncbi:MAG: hypothetical protein JSV62_10795 [Promethearchaeota archaeon]|nr:MAG: hypothetical protein JSV62_10795 [Candidatus Lokiarchaeota archaeon]